MVSIIRVPVCTCAYVSLYDLGISFEEFQLQGESPLDLQGMENQQFAIFVSFAEIYNEFIYDLLVPAPAKGKHRSALKISQDKHQNYYIKGMCVCIFM